jgi:APA family basic amino acid/polyamine antiporter
VPVVQPGTAVLAAATRRSATPNIGLVGRLVALSIFMVFAMPAFGGTNLHLFMPLSVRIGGDARATARTDGGGDHVRLLRVRCGGHVGGGDVELGRGRTIGIRGSIVPCTAISMAITAIGALLFSSLAGSTEPLALVPPIVGWPLAGRIVTWAAIIARPTGVRVTM